MIYNKTLFIIRQYYFKEKKLINYTLLLNTLRKEDIFYFVDLPTTIAIIQDTYALFKIFYYGKEKSDSKIQIPVYLNNTKTYSLKIKNTSIVNQEKIKIPTINLEKLNKYNFNNSFINSAISLLNSNEINDFSIQIPTQVLNKDICYFKLNPIYSYHWINLFITFTENQNGYLQKETSKNSKTMAIDFGINNLMTIVTSDSKSFIIDGKYLKSISHLYNKKLAIYNKNKLNQQSYTKKIFYLTNKRNNRFNDYIYKAARYVISYALKNEINSIIVGYNKEMKLYGIKSNVSKYKKQCINQSYMQTPLLKLKDRLKYLCKINNIYFEEINEAYTSICSFYDNEEICYHKNYKGERIKRGLFITQDKRFVNADVNGALNILAKSKPNSDVDLIHLRNSGILVPKRVHVDNIYRNKL